MIYMNLLWEKHHFTDMNGEKHMKINQQFIKNINLKLLYSLLFNNPGASRTSLAKAAGLSKTTVSSLVEELIRKEYIMDSGTTSSAIVGRKPNHLYLTGDRHCVITVCWEADSMNGALVDLDGKVLHKHTITLATTSQYTKYLHSLVDSIQKSGDISVKIIGICIIVPAMIDKKNRKIISTILQIDDEATVVDNIRKEFPELPLAFFNDTACFAYSERIKNRIDDNTFAFINLNQGIGAAFFVDGKMLGDASGTQTQFGHYSVDSKGIQCSCGNHGCLEAMIGEKVLKRLVTDCGNSEIFTDMADIRYMDVGKAAREGDQTAHLAISAIADNLSKGLCNLISLFRPNGIVIGGSGVNLGKEFLDELTVNIKNHGFRKMVDDVQICFSGQGEDACFIGAMHYYFDNCYSFTEDMQGKTFLG